MDASDCPGRSAGSAEGKPQAFGGVCVHSQTFVVRRPVCVLWARLRRPAAGMGRERAGRLGNIATGAPPLDFEIPAEITAYLAELDEFIEREIKPLERENDNLRFFD